MAMSNFFEYLQRLSLEKRLYTLQTLPRHLMDADQTERLHHLLTDLEFIEAKCAAEMVYGLQADYALALDILPEAQEEKARERTHEQQVERYTREAIAYARAWSNARERHAADPTNHPMPGAKEIPPMAMVPSVRPWTDEEIQADSDRIRREPSQLDQLRAFSEFVILNSHHFLQYASIPGFCIQQAHNYSDSGPVADRAEQFLSSWGRGCVLLQNPRQRPVYNPHPGLLRTLEGHTGFVNSVELTSDGATAVSGSDDGTLRVWDLSTGQCLRVLTGHTDSVDSVSITPDGRTAVSGSNDGTVRVWDLAAGQCLKVLTEHTDTVWGVSITPDGSRALSGGRDRTLRVWNLVTGQCTQSFEYESFIFHTRLTRDGNTGASGGYDGLWVWDLTTGKRLRVIEQGRGDKLVFAITPDGATALAIGRPERPLESFLDVWDLGTGQRMSSLHGHKGPILSVSLTPDGATAVSGSMDHNLCVWDLRTGKCLRVLTGHTDNVESVSITPDGRIAVSGSRDNTVRVWDLVTGQCLPTLKQSDSVGTISLTRSGATAVAGSDWAGRGLQIWDLATRRCLRMLEDIRSVKSISVTPDGTVVVSGSEHDNAIRVLDLTTGETLRVLTGHTDGVKSLSSSLDGRIAVSGSDDNTLRVWNVNTGQCLRVLQGHEGFIPTVSLTSDCTTAVSGSFDHTVRVWDLRTGQCRHILNGHSGTVWKTALTPDGRIAVSGSADHSVRVWDLVTGRCLHILKHVESIERISLTPDGRLAVTGEYDGSLRVWDLRTGRCLHRLEVSRRGGRPEVSLTPDGNSIVSGGHDGTLRIWSLGTGQCMAIFPATTEVQSLSEIRTNKPLAFATTSGEILFVTLYGHEFGMPIVTAVRAWLPGKGNGKGQWENHLTALCEYCGQRFEPVPVVLDAIRSISAALAPDQSPCLELPAEAWSEPRLLSECPQCHQPLRFNPFITDALQQDPHVLSGSRAYSIKQGGKKWWEFWK